jgi:hypothetical protein
MKQESQRADAGQLRLALEGICHRSQGRGLTIGEILEQLGERGYVIALPFLAALFLFPLPTMGLSAPVGILAMLGGAALLLGRRLWIPRFIASRRISHDVLARVTAGCLRVVDRVSSWLHPRWQFMFRPGLRQCIGLSLVSAGFILGLPLPLPFANAIPAAAVLLLCFGYLAADGVPVLLGHGVTLAAWAYLYAVGDVAWAVIRHLFVMGGSTVSG